MTKKDEIIFGYPSYLGREEFILERLRLTLSKMISENEVLRNDVHVHLQYWVNEIRVVFYRDIGCMKQEKKIYFQTPKTWWDHFKMRYRENWLIKKLKPIQLVKHEYDITKGVTFPDFRIPYGSEFDNKKYFCFIQKVG